VDYGRIDLYYVSPIINGLSDHDAQILTIQNMYATIKRFPFQQKTRLTDNEMIMTVLKNETVESVCTDTNPNRTFNSVAYQGGGGVGLGCANPPPQSEGFQLRTGLQIERKMFSVPIPTS
jgi:hypothetical protein